MRNRAFLFTYGDVTLQVWSTDFFVEYPPALALPSPTTIGVNLRKIWRETDAALTDLQRREDAENFQKEVALAVGKSGTLEVYWDSNDPADVELNDFNFELITLKNVKWQDNANNGALIFDLEFEWSQNAAVARALSFAVDGFTTLTGTRQNFLVEHGKKHRTSFVEPFRAAPVLIKNGPGLKALRVTAIVDAVTVMTPTLLSKRQRAEAIIKAWIDLKGESGTLTIDATEYTAMLDDAKPSNLLLPDAVVYELNFLYGYGT